MCGPKFCSMHITQNLEKGIEALAEIKKQVA